MEGMLVRILPAPWRFWSCWGKRVARGVRGEPINCKEPPLSAPCLSVGLALGGGRTVTT